jgi:hypothetical protein
MLHASGIDPLALDEKLLDPGRDASHLYLAALQLRTGDKEAALATLLPYIKRCFEMMTVRKHMRGNWDLRLYYLPLDESATHLAYTQPRTEI